MRTRALLALLLAGACSHADQVKETTPPQSVAKADPPATTATTTPTATPTPSPPDRRPSLDPIYFQFDEALLTADGQNTLRALGDWMNAHRSSGVTISGYADER